jgi:GH43 family beta-xylosidase
MQQCRTSAAFGRQVSCSAQRNLGLNAPELHQLDGKWYLYYTFESMSYVLEGGASVSAPPALQHLS